MVCNRGKALLLRLKNGNASGLQASPCHADAAVADPVLQQHKHTAELLLQHFCASIADSTSEKFSVSCGSNDGTGQLRCVISICCYIPISVHLLA